MNKGDDLSRVNNNRGLKQSLLSNINTQHQQLYNSSNSNNMALPFRHHRPSTSSGGLSRTFYEAKLRRRSNARRCTLCLLLVFGCLAVLYEAMWTYWLAGVNIPNVEHDPVTGRDRIRRRPDLSTKYDPNQHSTVHTYVVALLDWHFPLAGTTFTTLASQVTLTFHLFPSFLLHPESHLMPSWRVSLRLWTFKFQWKACCLQGMFPTPTLWHLFVNCHGLHRKMMPKEYHCLRT